MRVLSMMGKTGATQRLATSNTATALVAGVLTVDGVRCSAVLIQCDPGQANAVRVGLGGVTPTVGATGIGIYLYPGDALRIVGEYNCAYLKYINAVSGDNSAIQMSPEY